MPRISLVEKRRVRVCVCVGRVNENIWGDGDNRENFAHSCGEGGMIRAIFPPYDRILGSVFYARVRCSGDCAV